ncbi:cuticle protein 19-like [Phymastichus coffea]|uniref:cuticle protein 19-like n=1 Tax=Phymastichus coffea TaxID=108790 RepID=UPI00273BB4AC|nr:cuticle protein 19-like [Phymastichus coffea]
MNLQVVRYIGFLAITLLLAEKISSAEGGDAHSFQHFHGPVAGDDKEVNWVDTRGQHHQDYAAPAHYEFAYGVEDGHTGDYHGQKEHRDGKAVAGEYTVREPDGNIRTVKYHADEDGFHATVHNSRGNDHDGDSASYGDE